MPRDMARANVWFEPSAWVVAWRSLLSLTVTVTAPEMSVFGATTNLYVRHRRREAVTGLANPVQSAKPVMP